MQLFGYKDYPTGYYFIQGSLVSLYHKNILKTVTFLIDTGSQITSISYIDALSLAIDFSELQGTGPISMINASMPAVTMSNSGLSFTLPSGKTVITEFLDKIFVHNPILKTHETLMIPSILGLDFLSRYKLVLQNNYMILEK